MTYKENTAWFHNVEIRTCLVHSAKDRADTKRPDGGIEGIHLNILPETLRHILRRPRLATELKTESKTPTLICGGEW